MSVYDDNRAVLERDLAAINTVFPVHASMVLFRKEVEHDPDKIVQTARFLHDAGCLDLRFWIYRPIGDHPDPDEILFDNDPALLALREGRQDDPGVLLLARAAQAGPGAQALPSALAEGRLRMSGNLGICCGTDALLPAPGGNLFEVVPTPSSTTRSSSRCAANSSTRTRHHPRCAGPVTFWAIAAGSSGSVEDW